MRIIAGSFGGRRIQAPRGTTTRPTSDRVREALFSRLESIAGGLADRTVFDVYAGSGAMGLEALSRGALHATFIERDRAALAALRANIESLETAGDTTVLRGDVSRIAARDDLPGAPFGLLILDPPYRIENAEVREVIDSLVAHRALALGCLLVWEHDSGSEVDPGDGWRSLGSRSYGTTAVSVYETDSES